MRQHYFESRANMPAKIRSALAALAIAAAALGAALPAQASTFTVGGSGNTFIVTRDDTTAAETVNYRTVSLSAYAGQHYTAKSGTLTFAAGQTAVTNFVTEKTPTIDAYKFQTTTQRSYRFELTDEGGFPITNAVRSITTGTQLSTTYLNREVTDLVYFTSGGSITSGSGNKYLDVTYGPSSYRQVTDGGYNQAVHTVGTGSLYGNNAELRTFLDGIGCKMYATVYFTQKEEQDGYQYIQILADNATTYDGNDPNGAVDTPSTSIYKACFILSYTPSGSVMEDDHYQFFPHRYDYVDNAAETSAGISHYEFDNNNSHLYEQKFRNNTPSYRTSTSGSLVLATSVNNLNIRFDAAGSGGDTWDFKNLKVRLALVDTASPVMLTASAAAAPGVHAKGNDLYVSVAFNEPVTCSSASLTTTWGTLSHNSGSGSNVLTFKGKISASASGSLNITSWSGTIKDLAGNELAGSGALNQSNLASLTGSHSYTISYDLAGGALPGGSASNPTSYTYESDGITLANPVRTGYNFVGWTGTGITSPTNSVTIPAGSHGDRSYVAHWDTIPWAGTGTSVDPYVIIYPSQLDLLAAQVNAGDEFQNTYFVLGTNITYAYTTAWNDATSTENNYTAIGGSVGCFKGVFDGRGYTVSGIRIYKGGSGTADDRQGIFGRTSDGTVRNVTLADARITGSSSVGGIVGEAYRGEVSNCFVLDVALPDVEKSGAIVGNNNNATLAANYYHACTVAGTANAIGVGTGDGDVAGALSVFTVGGNDIAVAGTSAVTHDGTNYYVEGSVVTLSYTGELPAGATCGYVASAGILDGDSLTVPVADVTVTAYVMTGLTVNGRDVGFPSGPGWYSDGAHTVYLTNAGPFTVSGSTASGYGIEATMSAQVILSNATIDASAYEDCIAFRVASGASVDFSLIGSNTLKTSDGNSGLHTGRAALEVPEGASATIGGEGSLTATAGTASGYGGGAGIGGGYGQNAGTIEIRGGTITALSRNSGAGIGGGTGGNGGTITISGGVVNAQGRQSGIGGGYQGHGGTITISGGTVYASSTVDNRPDIGGMENSEAASCIISGGSVHAVNGRINPAAENANHVAVHCVTVSGLPPNTEPRISWLTTADSGYGQNDMWTDSNGRLYVWLPDGTHYFTVDGAGFRAVVDGADTAAESGLVVPYVDENGDVQICFGCTVITNAVGDVTYGTSGQENWYVVTTNVTINGKLTFNDYCAHLILCDGATLVVTNASGAAINSYNLTIYCQTNGTGSIAATAPVSGSDGISASSFTINGGIVSATGRYCGIYAYSVIINSGAVTATGLFYCIRANNRVTINGGRVNAIGYDEGIFASYHITLGWSDRADSITASSYRSSYGTVSVKDGQMLTDGVDTYTGTVDLAAIAGKTLRPAVPYIDGTGVERLCTDFTVLTNATGDVEYGEMDEEHWYVVTTNVTISGKLCFHDDYTHLILCDGATLTVTNASRDAIFAGGITIYGQAGGTGAVVANGNAKSGGYGINGFFVTINGGTVTANGSNGIFGGHSVIVNGGTVTANGSDGISGGNVTINGGTVTATVAVGDGITANNVFINGGRVTAIATNGGDGIRGSYIYLGWMNPDDSIFASSYDCSSGYVVVNDILTDGDVVYRNQAYILAVAGKTLRPAVPYIDGAGVERMCTEFTLITNAVGDVLYGASDQENWYVVRGDVTISGNLGFDDDCAHLIICDYATLAVTNVSGDAISSWRDIAIYGQSYCTGAVVANGSGTGIFAVEYVTINGSIVSATGSNGIVSRYSVTINGGRVTANGVSYGISGGGSVTINGGTVSATATGDGGSGIIVHSGDIALGWSDLADSITASSYGFYYGNGTLSIKEGQIFTDGVDSYAGVVDPAAIAGKTLMPCLSPWKLLQKRLDAGGMVKLAIDVTATNDDATLTVTNAVTLDLNGHVIDADYRFRAIQVLEGGDLVLTNSVEGAGAIVNGQDMRYGGGVYVENGAFTMSGGSICSNIAQQGCGVYVDGRRGSFTMTGGEISGNRPPISSSTMVSGYNGGGVYMKGGMFEMSGGSIADNNAGFNGGGVYMQGGTFTMSGGSVTNNYAPQNGGGVYMDGGTFTISSGEISGNIARYSGGGVFMYNTGSGDGTFTMSGGEISGNVAYANGVDNPRGGGGVFVSGGYEGFVMTGGTIISNSVQSSSSAYGGGVCVYGSATNTISGGMISGNFVTTTASENVWTFGGGVFVDKSTFAMTGGEISGNWSSKSGGGVCVRGDERHLFMMSGGAISGNAAYCIGMNGLGGGGVFVNSGVFEMSGGEISGNTAVGGGGVYVNNNSTFAMTNSVISGNEASKGGGVYMNSGHLYVSGVSSVSGNTNSVGAANNVYLPSGKKIGVGDLSAGASIGVTTQTEPTLANPVAFASGSAADGAHFFSDDPGFAVCVENNSLCLRAITPWERLQKRLDAGGMVKLASDVTATNDDATLMVANAVTLDLNGHVIDADGWFRVIEVLEGGNLMLTNSVEGAGAVIGGCDMHYGGGVYVHGGGAFMMAGGTISENAVTGGKYGDAYPSGGGVYVAGGTFTMTGGTIFNNAVSQDNGQGGGVYVNGGTIEISGGEISGNTAYGNGGGVYVTGSAFTISGGEISGNVVGPSSGTIGGGGVYVYGSSNSDRSTFTMTGGEISGNVVYASGSTDVYGGGGVYVNEYGTFAMSGGSIISNSVQSSGRAYGGGVCLKNNSGTGTMTGGTISGNFVDTTGDGGSIYAAGGGMFVNRCAFTMSGGEISGNWSSKNGGGVAVGGIGYAFVMTGGEISGNTAKCLGIRNVFGGGGVYVNNSATFAMTNSVVSGNVASKGGGVYVNVGTLRVSGSSVVSGNTNSVGQSRNVCLASSRTITVDGLAAGASIGVQTATEPTLGNSVKFATGALAGEEEYFFSDIYGYDVRLNGSDLLLAQLMAFPTYLEGADNSVRSNYVSWAARNGEDSNSEHEDAFLLNVAPAATPVGLRIDCIDVVDGGATVRVAATAGGDAVDMSQVNGVISLAAGDELGSLALTAVPSENVTYENGEATIFVPASDGTFIRARVGVATPGRP